MNITDDQEDLQNTVEKQNSEVKTFFTNTSVDVDYGREFDDYYTNPSDIYRKVFDKIGIIAPLDSDPEKIEDYYKKVFSQKSMGGIKNVLSREEGYKESKDKLNYELDWDFIQSIAERMSKNKGKYEPYNWKKPIDIESLKQSLFRHVIEVMKGDYEDDDRELGHLEAIALNAMFIFYNLKNQK